MHHDDKEGTDWKVKASITDLVDCAVESQSAVYLPRHKSKQNPVADMYSTGMLERIASKVGWRNICTLGYAQSFEKLGRTCEELQQGKSKARLIRALGQQEDNFEGGFRNACNTTDASASPAFLFVPSKSRVGEGRDARYGLRLVRSSCAEPTAVCTHALLR